VVQADGQMKTGRDIAIAALLGAEEWGVATAALVVEGCIMMRKCHMNTCPVGVATQDPELRKRFKGNPDHVVTFFEYITEELREIMAELGYKTVDEMIGQVDALTMRKNIHHWKFKNLDLSGVLYKEPAEEGVGLFNTEKQDHGLANVLDWKLLEAAQPAILQQQKVKASFNIKNTDRTAGTIVSNEITKVYKAAGLPNGTIHYKFTGTAGQSFGAFNTKGLTLELEGDANDYFGKGLSGAQLIVYPDKKAGFVAENNIIIGNTAFYGATSGEAYIRGKAGERFAVRNSGATVVTEGVGDHGCEYMTGGTAVILGSTGRNFAAGMSGGIAFVYNVQGDFDVLCNKEMVDLDPVADEDISSLKQLIQNHFNYTDSAVAKFILADFDNQLKHFIKVFPRDYKKALQQAKKTAIV
jgi:glutamate synthase (NADPH/NADH) large chain